MLGLHFCARAFSSCGKRGPLPIAVHGPLTAASSLVADRLQTHRLSSYGPRAQPLRGMWDPPRPGLEPMSPALAGGFSTTAPPGKPSLTNFVARVSLKNCSCLDQLKLQSWVLCAHFWMKQSSLPSLFSTLNSPEELNEKIKEIYLSFELWVNDNNVLDLKYSLTLYL